MQIQARPQTHLKTLHRPLPSEQSTLVEPPPDGYNPSDTTLAPLGLAVGASVVAGGATAYALMNSGAAANIAGAVGLGAAGAVIGGAAGLMVDIGSLGSKNTSTATTLIGAGIGAVGGALLSGNLGTVGSVVAGVGAALTVGVGTYAVAQEAFG